MIATNKLIKMKRGNYTMKTPINALELYELIYGKENNWERIVS